MGAIDVTIRSPTAPLLGVVAAALLTGAAAATLWAIVLLF